MEIWDLIQTLMLEIRYNLVNERTLYVKIHAEIYPVSCEVLNHVFSSVCYLEDIETFDGNAKFHSRIRFPCREAALEAFSCYDGTYIYAGCCRMELSLGGWISVLDDADLIDELDPYQDGDCESSYQEELGSNKVHARKVFNELSNSDSDLGVSSIQGVISATTQRNIEQPIGEPTDRVASEMVFQNTKPSQEAIGERSIKARMVDSSSEIVNSQQIKASDRQESAIKGTPTKDCSREFSHMNPSLNSEFKGEIMDYEIAAEEVAYSGVDTCALSNWNQENIDRRYSPESVADGIAIFDDDREEEVIENLVAFSETEQEPSNGSYSVTKIEDVYKMFDNMPPSKVLAPLQTDENQSNTFTGEFSMELISGNSGLDVVTPGTCHEFSKGLADFGKFSMGSLRIFGAYQLFDEMPLSGFNFSAASLLQENIWAGDKTWSFDPGIFDASRGNWIEVLTEMFRRKIHCAHPIDKTHELGTWNETVSISFTGMNRNFYLSFPIFECHAPRKWVTDCSVVSGIPKNQNFEGVVIDDDNGADVCLQRNLMQNIAIVCERFDAQQVFEKMPLRRFIGSDCYALVRSAQLHLGTCIFDPGIVEDWSSSSDCFSKQLVERTRATWTVYDLKLIMLSRCIGSQLMARVFAKRFDFPSSACLHSPTRALNEIYADFCCHRAHCAPLTDFGLHFHNGYETLAISLFDPEIVHKLDLQAVPIAGCWVLGEIDCPWLQVSWEIQDYVLVFDPGIASWWNCCSLIFLCSSFTLLEWLRRFKPGSMLPKIASRCWCMLGCTNFLQHKFGPGERYWLHNFAAAARYSSALSAVGYVEALVQLSTQGFGAFATYANFPFDPGDLCVCTTLAEDLCAVRNSVEGMGRLIMENFCHIAVLLKLLRVGNSVQLICARCFASTTAAESVATVLDKRVGDTIGCFNYCSYSCYFARFITASWGHMISLLHLFPLSP